ncbi:MAG: flagellar basal body-associated protein FliL [Caulobacteraceae bacterium]
MKKNIILIAIIILLLLVIISGIIIYMLLNTPRVPKEEPRKIDKNLVMVTVGDSFVNNVKDSKKICKLTLEIEVNKNISELVANRQSEIRDKINAMVRSKTEEDLAGQEGQMSLQKEILAAIQKILNTKEVVNIYFDEFIVQ